MSLEYSRPSTSKTTKPENDFLQNISVYFQKVIQYEDETLLALAKSHIPVITLQIKSMERMRSIQKAIKEGDKDLTEMALEDSLLVELLDWFKTSFFTWVDCPSCDFCNSPTKFLNTTSGMECGESIRVEVFNCELCDTKTKFPRYNKVKTLLNTRKGRCGEWANCFTLLCRSLGYDARLIVDNTDHVWTEVYSIDLKRWVHCDPCENVIDSPLMYESGWGKKLNYIIAYSKDEVQDVTWRYSSDHKAILGRRNRCTEYDLINTLLNMRENRWKKFSDERKKYLRKRLCTELVELMVERNANENEKVGRVSGSLAWRMERKEIFGSPYIWELDEYDEVQINYQASTNLYKMFTNDGKTVKTLKNWLNGIYDMQEISRKEEQDWKMVYLCRSENSKEAKISWKFKTIKTKAFEKFVIKTSSQTYKSGVVVWTVEYENKTFTIPKELESNFSIANCDNLREIVLTANLSGGDGSLAWQHSQIFRQKLDDNNYPLEIIIKLKKSSN